MTYKIKRISTLFLVTLSLIIGVLFLANPSAHAASLPFDVVPVGKTYQDLGYFRFEVKPDHEYDVPVQIRNTSNKTLTVEISKLNGMTNANGSDYLQYFPQEKLSNSRLTDEIRALIKYVSGPEKVTLKPGQSKICHYKLKTPHQITDGSLVGALAIKQEGQKLASEKKGKIVIGNQVERVIGIEGDYEKKGQGDIISDRPKVVANPSAPYVLVKLKNESSNIVKDVKLSYAVKQGSKQLFNGRSRFKMAPKTEIGYPAKWNYNTFAPGEYNLDMTLVANGKKEEKTYHFVVQDKKVKDYQRQTSKKPVAVVSSKMSIFAGILIGLFVAGLGFVGYILYRKKSEKKD